MAPVRSLVTFAALSCALSLAPAVASAQVPPGTHPPRWWFNFDLEAGVAYRFHDDQWFFRPRARVGPSLFRNWQFWNLSATVESLGLSRVAFGLLVGLDDVDYGVSAFAGGTVSLDGNPGVTLGGGWKWFTVEGQVHFDAGAQWVVSAGLRVPIGSILMAVLAPPTTFRMPRPGRPGM